MDKRIKMIAVALALGSLAAIAVVVPGPRAEVVSAGVGDSGHSIVLEVEGVGEITPLEIQGIGIDLEVIEFQDGDDLFLRKRPGRTKYPDVKFTLPIGAQSDLIWIDFEQVIQGQYIRRQWDAIVKDETGTEVLRYELHEVWPSSWAMVDIGTEEWTLTYEQLMRKLPE